MNKIKNKKSPKTKASDINLVDINFQIKFEIDLKTVVKFVENFGLFLKKKTITDAVEF